MEKAIIMGERTREVNRSIDGEERHHQRAPNLARVLRGVGPIAEAAAPQEVGRFVDASPEWGR